MRISPTLVGTAVQAWACDWQLHDLKHHIHDPKYQIHVQKYLQWGSHERLPELRLSLGLSFCYWALLALALLSMLDMLHEDLVKRHLRVTIPQDPFLNLPMTWGGLKRTPTRNDLKQCSGTASAVDVMWLQPSGDATIPHCVQLGSWRQCNADLTQFWDFRQLECNSSLGKQSVWLTVRADVKKEKSPISTASFSNLTKDMYQCHWFEVTFFCQGWFLFGTLKNWHQSQADPLPTQPCHQRPISNHTNLQMRPGQFGKKW